MQTRERKNVLGMITDDKPMFDLPSKFLRREGCEVKRVLHDISEDESCAMMAYAPARGWSHFRERSFRTKDSFENLKAGRPALLMIQSNDRDCSDGNDNIIMLPERQLNLKHLSGTIKKRLTAESTASW